MAAVSDIHWAADACLAFLAESAKLDWDVSVPDLDLSVAGVVAHAAEGCLWYAIDLSANGKDLQAVVHGVKVNSTPGELVDTLAAYANIVASVVETSPPEARGFHPMGKADPSGFAAMACDEILIHTDDAARGLGLLFSPPPGLARSVLARLFPWVDPITEPWAQLRWANGRTALGELPRLNNWAWHCAPLDEWDGTILKKTGG